VRERGFSMRRARDLGWSKSHVGTPLLLGECHSDGCCRMLPGRQPDRTDMQQAGRCGRGTSTGV